MTAGAIAGVEIGDAFEKLRGAVQPGDRNIHVLILTVKR